MDPRRNSPAGSVCRHPRLQPEPFDAALRNTARDRWQTAHIERNHAGFWRRLMSFPDLHSFLGAPTTPPTLRGEARAAKRGPRIAALGGSRTHGSSP